MSRSGNKKYEHGQYAHGRPEVTSPDMPSPAVRVTYVLNLFQSVLAGQMSLASFFADLDSGADYIGPGTQDLIKILRPVLREVPANKAEAAVAFAIKRVNEQANPKADTEPTDAARLLALKRLGAIEAAKVEETAPRPKSAPSVVSKRTVVVTQVFGLYRRDVVDSETTQPRLRR